MKHSSQMGQGLAFQGLERSLLLAESIASHYCTAHRVTARSRLLAHGRIIAVDGRIRTLAQVDGAIVEPEVARSNGQSVDRGSSLASRPNGTHGAMDARPRDRVVKVFDTEAIVNAGGGLVCRHRIEWA